MSLNKKDKPALKKLVTELENSVTQKNLDINGLDEKLMIVTKKNQELLIKLEQVKMEVGQLKNLEKENLKLQRENLQLRADLMKKDVLIDAAVKTATAKKLHSAEEKEIEKVNASNRKEKNQEEMKRGRSRSRSLEQKNINSPTHRSRERRRDKSKTPDRRDKLVTLDYRRQTSRSPDYRKKRSRSGERKRLDYRYYPKRRYYEESTKVYQQNSSSTLHNLQKRINLLEHNSHLIFQRAQHSTLTLPPYALNFNQPPPALGLIQTNNQNPYPQTYNLPNNHK